MFFDEVLPPPDLGAGNSRVRSVLAAAIGSPRTAQGAMQALSTLLPLDACNLAHLKRISKISVGPTSSGEKSLMVLLAPAEHWYALSEGMRQQVCTVHQLGPPVEMQVPAHAAESREEFDEAQTMGWWPQTFHPRTPTATIAGLPLTSSDAAAMLYYLWAALADRAAGGDGSSSRSSSSSTEVSLPAGGVLVNPRTGEVMVCASRVRSEMARGWTAPGNATTAQSQHSLEGSSGNKPTHSITKHPLHTATMLCVHGLAWYHQASRNKSYSSKGENISTEPRSKRSRDEVKNDSEDNPVGSSCKDGPAESVRATSETRFGPPRRDLARLGAVPWCELLGAEAAAKTVADMAKDEEQKEITTATAAAAMSADSETEAASTEVTMSESEVTESRNAGSNIKKVIVKEEEEVPYLCTGLDLYLTHEVRYQRDNNIGF